jgi:hypothetical protein
MYKTGHTIDPNFNQSSQVTCTDCGQVFSLDDLHVAEELREGLCLKPKTPLIIPKAYNILGKRLR